MPAPKTKPKTEVVVRSEEIDRGDKATDSALYETKRKKKEKGQLAWGGALPVANEKDNAQVIAAFCNKVAEIYGVPSMGVNAMGNKPYLNKDGRLYLLHDLRKGKDKPKAIRKEFLQMSRSIQEAAIIKVTLVFADHEVEAIGEASQGSVKLDAVKQTLNMMAETRGLNRAIWQEVAGDVWNRVADNLKAAKLTEQERADIENAGAVSYEEMSRPDAAPTVAKSADKPKTMSEFESIALGLIAQATTVDSVIKVDEKAAASAIFDGAAKKRIHEAATARASKLDNAA